VPDLIPQGHIWRAFYMRFVFSEDGRSQRFFRGRGLLLAHSPPTSAGDLPPEFIQGSCRFFFLWVHCSHPLVSHPPALNRSGC